jgi:hypothetical protein
MTYGMLLRQEIGKTGCNLGAFCTPFAPKNDTFNHPGVSGGINIAKGAALRRQLFVMNPHTTEADSRHRMRVSGF